MERSSATSEWGLASLLIGCATLLLLPLLVLVLFQIVDQHGNPIWTAQQRLTFANFGLLATVIPMALVVAGVFFALVGLFTARRFGGSRRLSWAGLVVCLLALSGTVVVVVFAREVQWGVQQGFDEQIRKTNPIPRQ